MSTFVNLSGSVPTPDSSIPPALESKITSGDSLPRNVEAAKQRLKDTASDLQSETVSQQASIDASRMIADAEGQMAAGREAIATLEHRLAQLKILRENLTLRSPMTGVVLTNDLDLRTNQE